MKIAEERCEKGRRKMRAVAQAIGRLHDASQNARGGLCGIHGVELHDFDDIANATDEALVAIRTLDKEIFEISAPAEYRRLREESAQGQVLRGLLGPRNSAVHDGHVIDPHCPRAVGPLPNGRFIVWPRWSDPAHLPDDVFARDGKIQRALLSSYERSVAGRPVIDTLMDAYAFFRTLEPTLAPADADGQLEYFPLRPVAVPGYVRLHPAWPDRAEMERLIREETQSSPPDGDRREIVGAFHVDDDLIVCGWTRAVHGAAFTESVHQVARDIDYGYAYVVAVPEGLIECRSEGGQVTLVDGTALDLAGLDDPSIGEPQWARWWEVCEDDAAYYRRQRRLT